MHTNHMLRQSTAERLCQGGCGGDPPLEIVIPNEVRDLHLNAKCRSLTSFGMTKSLGLDSPLEDPHRFKTT